MGNSRSKLRKFNRRGSIEENLTTISLPCPKKSDCSLSSSTSLIRGTDSSRSHSLASNATSSDVSSRISVPDEDTFIAPIEVPPKMLTEDQLELVKFTWHLVLNDR